MKKFPKILVVCGGLLMTLTACGDQGGDQRPHTHSYTSENISWDWADDFSSVTATATCSGCDETLTATVEGEDIESIVTASPSCTSTGTREYSATVMFGGEQFTDTAEQILQQTEHSYGELIQEKPATCTTDGTRAHYQCAFCDEKFVFEGGAYVEKTDAELTIPAKGHSYGTLVLAKDAGCETNGNYAYYHCSDCGKYFNEDKVEKTLEQLTIYATGHNYGELISEDPATCTEDGMRAHYHCDECDKYFVKDGNTYTEVTSDSLIITAPGHQYGDLIEEVPPVCGGADGVKAHYHCDGCGKDFLKVNENYVETSLEDLKISADAHNIQYHAKVEAVCGESDGMEAHYECENCHKCFTDEAGNNEVAASTLVIEHTEHNYSDWQSTGASEHSKECSNCNDVVTEAHAKTYTQLDNMQHKEECSTCDYEATVECVFGWSENGYRCECGRKATMSIQQKIDLDLVVETADQISSLAFGDRTEALTITGIGQNTIDDVKIGETSVWDKTNEKFSLAVAKFPGVQTLIVTLTNGTYTDEYSFETTLVSKTFTTEAELRTFNAISKLIGGESTNVWDGYFELGANITLTSYANNDSWRLADTVANTDVDGKLKEGFVGTLDGNGYSINKMYLAEEKAAFIRCMNGVVKNISFSQFITSKRYASIFSIGGGTIENVFFAPWNITNNYNAPFFGDNCEKGYVPTIKNLVVDTTGEVYGGTFVANYGGGGYQGNLISSNWGGTLPNIDHIRINGLAYDSSKGIADRTGDKEKSIWWFYNYFCSYHFTKPANTFQIKSIDDVIALGKDVVYYEGLDEFGYNESEDWINTWNAIWKDGAATRKFTKLEKRNEMSLTKGKSTNGVSDNLVLVESVQGAAKTQYSIDQQNWVDCSTTIDTTTIFDVDTLYVRQLDAQDQVLDSKSIEIDRKMIFPTAYNWGGKYSFGTTNHGFVLDCTTYPNNWGFDAESPKYSNTKYDGGAAYDLLTLKIDGVDGGSEITGQNAMAHAQFWDNMKDGSGEVIWQYNNGATFVHDYTKMSFWCKVLKIELEFDNESKMELNKFYKPELIGCPATGWSYQQIKGNGSDTVKTGGYNVGEWYEIQYDINSSTNFGYGLFFGYYCTQDTLFNNGVTDNIVGSTYDGKTVTNIHYYWSVEGASLSYNLPQD